MEKKAMGKGLWGRVYRERAIEKEAMGKGLWNRVRSPGYGVTDSHEEN